SPDSTGVPSSFTVTVYSSHTGAVVILISSLHLPSSYVTVIVPTSSPFSFVTVYLPSGKSSRSITILPFESTEPSTSVLPSSEVNVYLPDVTGVPSSLIVIVKSSHVF